MIVGLDQLGHDLKRTSDTASRTGQCCMQVGLQQSSMHVGASIVELSPAVMGKLSVAELPVLP